MPTAMYAPISNIPLLLVIITLVIVLTPFIFVGANSRLHRPGSVSFTKPPLLNLFAISFGIWFIVLLLPFHTSATLGVLLVWLTAYRLLVSAQVRAETPRQALIMASVITALTLLGIGAVLAVVDFGLL